MYLAIAQSDSVLKQHLARVEALISNRAGPASAYAIKVIEGMRVGKRTKAFAAEARRAQRHTGLKSYLAILQ